MRRLLAAIVLPLAVAACGPSQEDTAAYNDAVRCYNASSVYAQFFVITGQPDSAKKLLDYAKGMRSKAITLGNTVGKDEKAVTAEFKDGDQGYLHKFYIISDGAMTPTGFAASEILYCGLTPVVGQ